MNWRFIVVVAAGLFLAGGTGQGQAAAPRLTLGASGGEDEVSASGEALIPLVLTDSTCLFALPRLERTDRDETQGGFGLGVRHLAGGRLILGGHVFYDSHWTRNDNRFDSLGAGVELLTRWVDVRANCYLPERGAERIESLSLKDTEVRTGSRTQGGSSEATDYGDIYAEDHALLQESVTVVEEWRVTEFWRRETTTTRLYDRFEEALEGWDAELGVRLPVPDRWGEYRLFGGWYDFQGRLTDGVRGLKGRFEARVLRALTLDAAVFEDRELYGTDWYAGFRVTVPLEWGRKRLSGALAGRVSVLRARLVEPVMRARLVVRETDWIEDETKKQVEVKTSSRTDEHRSVSTNTATHTVLGDVNFVDSGAGTNGAGTAEAPYATIQVGVSNAFGAGNVYVYAGSYSGVVQATRSVSIYGAGAPIQGLDGKTYGGGAYPELSGGFVASNIPSFALRGMTLTGPQDGIQAHNVAVLDIRQNIFRDKPERGVGIWTRGDSVVYAAIQDNVFNNVGRLAYTISPVYVEPRGESRLTLDISGNVFEQLPSDAIRLQPNDESVSVVTISDNRIRNTQTHGIWMLQGGHSTVELNILNNHIAQAALNPNGYRGIYIQAYGFYSPSLRLRVEGNTITECGGMGLAIGAVSSASIVAGVRHNTLLGNSGAAAMWIETYSMTYNPRLCLQLMNNFCDYDIVLNNDGGSFMVEDVLDTNTGRLIIPAPGVTLVPYGSCNTP